MILAAYLVLATQQQQGKNPYPVNTARPTFMVIYKERSVAINGIGGAQPGDIHGSSISYDRVGLINWKVLDGGYKGIPGHIYTGDGKWTYQIDVKHTARMDFHEAGFTMSFAVGLDGTPLHSESHFTDKSETLEVKTIDIVTDYEKDHILIKKTADGVVTSREIYPKGGMEEFSGMFQPIISQGLVLHRDMDCAVIHPYTGMPYEFKIHVANRFNGQYFFMPQEGYTIEVDGPEGKGTLYVTREGQLIQEFLPNKFQACLEEGPAVDERTGWGHFDIMDWDKGTDVANPDRPTYHTLAVPVMFDHPKLLFPVPCAITD